MKNKSEESCCCHSHMKKHATCMFLVGLAVIANAYWAFTSWAMLIGAIIALTALAKIVMPRRNCK